MRLVRITLATSLSVAGLGCHSAQISATIANHSKLPVTLVELDYPSASFGVQQLAPGEEYHYRFKVLGSGPTTVLWSDPKKRDQKNTGPVLREGDEGALEVNFEPGGPVWKLNLVHGSVR